MRHEAMGPGTHINHQQTIVNSQPCFPQCILFCTNPAELRR